jgi:peptide/nickel transport system ATP-binding protein
MQGIRGKKISMIFQDPMTALNPVIRIGDQIAEVILLHEKCSKAEAEKKATEMLEMVGIRGERYLDYPHQLSGGMKQRVVIAISTILKPKVLIADEPSSALDVTSQKMVIKMLREMMDKGMIQAMIFITHELPLLYNVTDDIMVMYAGQIVERGTAKQMVFDPVHPYSRGLMNSILVPEEGTRDVKLKAIPGTPPNLKKPPAGCRFAERCPYARPACTYNQMPILEFAPGRTYRCGLSVDELREIYRREDAEKGGSAR